LIVLTFAFGIMLASTISTASVVVFAQKNQTKTASSSGNQTTTNVTPAGKQATRIINQTSIPANQTTTTIQKKTEPVGNIPIPSSNQLKLSPPGSQAKLPAVSNQTTVTPIGKATTTVINQTSTPLNVTSTNATTATKQPQTSPSATNQTAAAPSPSSGGSNQTAAPSQSSSSSAGGGSSNQTAAKQQPSSSPPSSAGGGGGSNQTAAKQQSSNNSSSNPLSKVPVIGNLFGGK
jgi:hypothetical protein